MSAQMSFSSVPLEELTREPYVGIFCYPRPSEAEASQRLAELKELGIQSVIFEGPTKIGSLGLVGKGCVSLVLKVVKDQRTLALKIRRVDANRPTLDNESRMTYLANEHGVGPKLHSHSKNFILMELIEGLRILDWLKHLHGPGMMKGLRIVLKEILDQCRRLDEAGIDHGELSTLHKHVYVSDHVHIIDFETASLTRRLANVTCAVQYLFIGGPRARALRRLLRLSDTQPIIDAIRSYKQQMDDTSYANLLLTLALVKSPLAQH